MLAQSLSILSTLASGAAGELARTCPSLNRFIVFAVLFDILYCYATCCLKVEVLWPSSATLSLPAPQPTEPRPTSQQQHLHATGLGTRLHSAPCLLECASGSGRQKIRKQHSDPVVAPSAGLKTIRPLHSSPRLSELLQRNPLPTILGSPSRVSQLCVCMCVRKTVRERESEGRICVYKIHRTRIDYQTVFF